MTFRTHFSSHLIHRDLILSWKVLQIVQKSFILFFIAIYLIFMIERSNTHLNLKLNPSMENIDIESHDLLRISMEIMSSWMSITNTLIMSIVFHERRHVQFVELSICVNISGKSVIEIIGTVIRYIELSSLFFWNVTVLNQFLLPVNQLNCLCPIIYKQFFVC